MSRRLLALTVALAVGAAIPAGAAPPRRLSVVASFYPLAEWAAAVGGERVAVQNLTPAGSEPHDFEPTPGDLRRIREADVVVTLGAGFQPAVDRALAWLTGRQVRFVATEGLRLRTSEEARGHDEAAGGRAGGATSDGRQPGDLVWDPHVWLDPLLAKAIVAGLAAALARADPAGRAVYEANARAYAARLEALDATYRQTLAACRRRELVTSHASFGYLVARYGLEQEAIGGISPEAEPTPGRLAALVNFVRTHDVRYIFTETLVSPRVAETLARETGVSTLVLNPLEGLSSRELALGKDYFSVMEENLRSLATGLECRLP